MQSINDGSSNIQPNPNIIKEGPLHKELLPELHEKIMSYLNNEDTSTLFLLTSKLNEKTIHVVKNQEFLKVASFGRSLADKLPDAYKNQKEALSHLISSDDYKAPLNFDRMKEKLDTVKAQIKEILLTIPQKDLANLFDSFKGQKPKLYFEFVPLSEKHAQLHRLLNVKVAFSDGVKEILQEGAYATEETFQAAVSFLMSAKIKILSKAGFKPRVNNLNQAIECYTVINRMIRMKDNLPMPGQPQQPIKRDNETMLALLDAGFLTLPGQTHESMQKDIDTKKNKVNETIIALLDAGAEPSKETLALAKKLNVDMSIFDKYIK